MSYTVTRIVGILLLVLGTCVGLPATQETADPPHAQPAIETAASKADTLPYRMLATRRASTLERELNEAAAAGFRFVFASWGDDEFPPLPGDRNETMVLMGREEHPGRFSYRVVPPRSESELEAALNEAGEAGFRIRAVTRSIILERDETEDAVATGYRVVTTTRVATLEREIAAAARAGYLPVGIRPPFAIEGLVAVLSRARSNPAPATAP